jgi:U32 family peptidase
VVASRRIVAPVCSPEDAERAIAAGAEELYCGAMFDEWVHVFGDADFLSRRQGRTAHLRSPEQMADVVAVAAARATPVALAVNARYTRRQVPYVLELVSAWERAGGQAVLLSDVGLLQNLRDRRSKLELHLSTLAGVFNSAAVAFFERLGVTRIVLPRDLTLAEIRALTEAAGTMEYEVLAMYQKCEFVDGVCGFYHGTRVPRDVPSAFDYEADRAGGRPVAWTSDPAYEGHGCQLEWETTDGDRVKHLGSDDARAPHCAACSLTDLEEAGIGWFKIAGRSYPSEQIVRAISFLRDVRGDGRETYADTFGSSCDARRCYYSRGDT